MGDEPDIWQKYAERTRRQEELKRLDEWLRRTHNERPLLFNLLTVAISLTIGVIAIGIRILIEWLTKRV